MLCVGVVVDLSYVMVAGEPVAGTTGTAGSGRGPLEKDPIRAPRQRPTGAALIEEVRSGGRRWGLTPAADEEEQLAEVERLLALGAPTSRVALSRGRGLRGSGCPGRQPVPRDQCQCLTALAVEPTDSRVRS